MSEGVARCQKGPAQQSRTTAAPRSIVHVVFLFDVILYHPRDGCHSLHLGLQGTQQHPEAGEAGTGCKASLSTPRQSLHLFPPAKTHCSWAPSPARSASCHALQGTAFPVQGR